MAIQGEAAPPAAAGEEADNKQKRLILCFDGTWNAHEDQTNVARLYDAVADYKGNCNHQQKFYDEGVGTDAKTKLIGGITGHGLEENILQGYCWLIRELARDEWSPKAKVEEDDGQTFDVGPDIFLFGFSRGAYTARSLGGLINRCGVPKLESLGIKGKDGKPEKSPTLEQIRNAPRINDAWKLYRHDFNKDYTETEPDGRLRSPSVAFRAEGSWAVKIKFLGVWDTVGSRGLPMIRSAAIPFSQSQYAFHDTGLGRVVENAFHAIAIDEHREDYDVTLWTAKHKMADAGKFVQTVEQRWFPGAHSNVGGGYQDDLLRAPPLEWMANRAKACGLQFIKWKNPPEKERDEPNCITALPQEFTLSGNEHEWPVRDSYDEFMFGAYSVFKRITKGKVIASGRHYRSILVRGVEEKVDPTATLKMASDANYRPSNLALAGLKP